MPVTPKAKELKNKLEQDILESGVTYGEVIWILNYFVAVYRDKANNLLNGTSIQKVVDTPRFNWIKNPDDDTQHANR